MAQANSIDADTSGIVSNTGTGFTGLNPSTVGSWVFLGSQTAANVASVSFVTGISSAYNTYKVVASNVAASASTYLQCQISINGGSSYIAANYLSGCLSNAYNASTFANTNATTSFKCSPSMTNTATDTISFDLCLSDLSSGAETKAAFTGYAILASTAFYILGGGFNTNASQVNAIQFSMASGNIKTGKFSLYGLVES